MGVPPHHPFKSGFPQTSPSCVDMIGYDGFLKYTPSHHPFQDGIFPYVNHPALGDPPWKTPQAGSGKWPGGMCHYQPFGSFGKSRNDHHMCNHGEKNRSGKG